MSLVSWIAIIIVILLAAGAIFVIINDKKNKKSSGDVGYFGCSVCSRNCPLNSENVSLEAKDIKNKKEET